jgi:hypothetical protein
MRDDVASLNALCGSMSATIVEANDDVAWQDKLESLTTRAIVDCQRSTAVRLLALVTRNATMFRLLCVALQRGDEHVDNRDETNDDDSCNIVDVCLQHRCCTMTTLDDARRGQLLRLATIGGRDVLAAHWLTTSPAFCVVALRSPSLVECAVARGATTVLDALLMLDKQRATALLVGNGDDKCAFCIAVRAKNEAMVEWLIERRIVPRGAVILVGLLNDALRARSTRAAIALIDLVAPPSSPARAFSPASPSSPASSVGVATNSDSTSDADIAQRWFWLAVAQCETSVVAALLARFADSIDITRIDPRPMCRAASFSVAAERNMPDLLQLLATQPLPGGRSVRVFLHFCCCCCCCFFVELESRPMQ